MSDVDKVKWSVTIYNKNVSRFSRFADFVQVFVGAAVYEDCYIRLHDTVIAGTINGVLCRSMQITQKWRATKRIHIS